MQGVELAVVAVEEAARHLIVDEREGVQLAAEREQLQRRRRLGVVGGLDAAEEQRARVAAQGVAEEERRARRAAQRLLLRRRRERLPHRVPERVAVHPDLDVEDHELRHHRVVAVAVAAAAAVGGGHLLGQLEEERRRRRRRLVELEEARAAGAEELAEGGGLRHRRRREAGAAAHELRAADRLRVAHDAELRRARREEVGEELGADDDAGVLDEELRRQPAARPAERRLPLLHRLEDRLDRRLRDAAEQLAVAAAVVAEQPDRHVRAVDELVDERLHLLREHLAVRRVRVVDPRERVRHRRLLAAAPPRPDELELVAALEERALRVGAARLLPRHARAAADRHARIDLHAGGGAGSATQRALKTGRSRDELVQRCERSSCEQLRAAAAPLAMDAT